MREREERERKKGSAHLSLACSRSTLSSLFSHFPAASPPVRAHLADPAVRAAAARVLAAPASATEPVLDAEISAAGALGPLAAAVLGTLAPDETGLL